MLFLKYIILHMDVMLKMDTFTVMSPIKSEAPGRAFWLI